jgi:hypothetical protein
LQVEGLGVRQGKLAWSLDKFSADCAGAKLAFSGDIAHAPEMRHWDLFQGGSATNQPVRQAQLKRLSDVLDRIHFDGTPQLNLTVNGDARDLHSFLVRLKFAAAGAHTPWFKARDLRLAASLTAPAGAPAKINPAWGFWTNVQPYRLTWSGHLSQFQSEKFNADFAAAAGFWRAP